MDDNRIRVNMLPEDSDRGYGLDAGKLYAVIGKLVLETESDCLSIHSLKT